ncbi:MAG: 1-acyl-sn-glycerol-3-phosphate acyltransferase [Rickettsiales bacterium]|nr:1-acyl-sn-glycerol-3-phosphate acyltransferase [Rickettsiales bacterium]
MIWKLRILLFYTLISLVMVSFFILFWLPLQFIPSSFKLRYRLAVFFSYIFIHLMWIICSIKYNVEGIEKIPTNGKPILALSNHQSFWENFFVQLIIPMHTWVIKKELYDIPVFGPSLKTVEPIAVDRTKTNSVSQILEEGSKKIANGISIVMFPESTRVKATSSVKFKPSAAKLALDTSTPILLFAHNAGLVWPKGFWFSRPGTVKVKIIEYISKEQLSKFSDPRELTEYIQEKINNEKTILVNQGVTRLNKNSNHNITRTI